METFIENKKVKAISTTEQMMWYLNAQNLVNTWNNFIIFAKTGEEQLVNMKDSGVFADDIDLIFDLGEHVLKFKGLLPDALEFYTQFVDGLKKQRYNIASNLEIVEFGKDYLRFNFRHGIFMGETLSFAGNNQCVMRKDGQRYYLSSAHIKALVFNTQHAY